MLRGRALSMSLLCNRAHNEMKTTEMTMPIVLDPL